MHRHKDANCRYTFDIFSCQVAILFCNSLNENSIYRKKKRIIIFFIKVGKNNIFLSFGGRGANISRTNYAVCLWDSLIRTGGDEFKVETTW